MQENAAQVFGELSGVELGIVDPLGAILPDGFDYLQLISSIADAFAKCLLRSS
ncbi:MAG: ABC-type Zn2+ transport system substrate-binding protein/surface adhesin [Paracoccaceae bacterium]|jgi:ABC-type Zn2+ transport system substrate-binding protein/surface adhesin